MARPGLIDPSSPSQRQVRQTGPDALEEVAVDAAYPAFAPSAGEGQGALLRLDPSAGIPTSLAGTETLAATC